MIHNYSHFLTKLINSRHRSRPELTAPSFFSWCQITSTSLTGSGNLTLLSATLDLEEFSLAPIQEPESKEQEAVPSPLEPRPPGLTSGSSSTSSTLLGLLFGACVTTPLSSW